MSENKKKSGLHYAWLVLLGLCGPQFFTVSAWYVTASLYFPYVTEELGVTTTSLALYLTIHGLVLAAMIGFVSKVVQKVNVKKILVIGNIAICLAFMAMSQFTNVWMWYVAALITGTGAAFVQMLTPMLIINNWFVKKVGFVNGLFWTAGGAGGIVLSPVVSGLLNNFGWRTTYIIMGCVGLIGVLFVALFVTFRPEDKGLLPYGAEDNDTAMKEAGVKTASYGPTAEEAKKSSVFLLTIVVTLCLTIAGSFQSLMSTYASAIELLAISGVMMSCYMVGNTVGKFLLPTLVDKLKIAMTTSAGCAGGILGAVFMVLAANTGTSTFLLIGGALLGFAAASMSLIPLIIRSCYGTKDYGKLYPSHQIAQTLIGCLGITIYSIIIEKFGVLASMFVIIIALTVAIIAIGAAIKKAKNTFNF